MADIRYENLLKVAHAYGFILEPHSNGVIGRRDGWTCLVVPNQEFIFYKSNSRWGGSTPFEFAALLHQKTGFEFDPELMPAFAETQKISKPN